MENRYEMRNAVDEPASELGIFFVDDGAPVGSLRPFNATFDYTPRPNTVSATNLRGSLYPAKKVPGTKTPVPGLSPDGSELFMRKMPGRTTGGIGRQVKEAIWRLGMNFRYRCESEKVDQPPQNDCK